MCVCVSANVSMWMYERIMCTHLGESHTTTRIIAHVDVNRQMGMVREGCVCVSVLRKWVGCQSQMIEADLLNTNKTFAQFSAQSAHYTVCTPGNTRWENMQYVCIYVCENFVYECCCWWWWWWCYCIVAFVDDAFIVCIRFFSVILKIFCLYRVKLRSEPQLLYLWETVTSASALKKMISFSFFSAYVGVKGSVSTHFKVLWYRYI